MTSHEIALKFSEKLQFEYQVTDIHVMMEELREAIDQHVKNKVKIVDVLSTTSQLPDLSADFENIILRSFPIKDNDPPRTL